MDRDAPIRPNQACERPMMRAPEPAIRLHGSGQRRERGQRGERLERRLIAAGLPLVRTLMIGMVLELLSDTLVALALGATPMRVWATSPTLWVLTPATNICINPSAMWGHSDWSVQTPGCGTDPHDLWAL